MTPDDPDEDTNPGETLSRPSFQHKSGKDETGDLAKVSLEDVLTNLFCARSTGTLTVGPEGGEPEGELVIWKGDVLAASAGKHEGEEAVLAVLKRRDGTFRFTEDIEPREQNVRKSVPDLVAEAARRRGDQRPGGR
ncbi:MAG: DUF4388 domain-containing protein [Planctomycetota bacterium]